jgi:hypothetical protein
MTPPPIETVPIGVHTTPRSIRNTVTQTLTRWGMGRLAEDARLIADEIVTNAIVHGAPPARFWMYIYSGQLVLEVTDSSPVLPSPRHADDDAEDGRGFVIIDALAAAWGVDELPGGVRKRVWAVLEIEAPSAASMYAHLDDPPTVVLQRIAA